MNRLEEWQEALMSSQFLWLYPSPYSTTSHTPQLYTRRIAGGHATLRKVPRLCDEGTEYERYPRERAKGWAVESASI
jgi:hypothetical protein